MNTSPKHLLILDNVHSAYGPITAVNGVSLQVDRGEIVSLIGANGAGKSSLLMTIFGNPRAHQGTILFKGGDITTMETHRIARMGIAQVPEGRRVFSHMTVAENLAMGAMPVELSGKKKTEAESKITSGILETVYTMFPVLEERRNQRAGTLSGGEQQMLAIGRALMSRPQLLLLDEPSLGLAPLISKKIFSKLKEIAATGTTIFLVEQNANQALRLADRGYVLVNGEIRLQGTGQELLKDPEVRKAYLGGH
ncbi:MAG: ABC transporter ATP-binding protein [Magnetococcales bacterium]|nr:ABC transporter ATP-binding protein [Magnetococcales bacterium]